MLTVAERVARSGRDFAYVLFLEGVPWAFTDREELCGSGGFSWIGVDNGDREVLPGLTVPETMESSTNLETGMLEGNDGLTFTVVDFDRRLIAYLRSLDAEAELVSEHLSPKTTPAPATLISADGQSDVTIHGKWLSHEAIGSDGKRRIYQLFPGDPLPGYDHAAIDSDVQDIGPSPVYSEPTHFVGRKCALYRVFRDVTSGETTYPYWASMEDSLNSGYGLIWVGTVEEMSAEGTTWKIACNGPSAHLCKQLGVNRPSQWLGVRSRLRLRTTPGERQDLIALACCYVGIGNGVVSMGGSSIFDTTTDVLPATGPLSDILSTIQARLSAITSAVGPDITWDTTKQAEATFVYGYATCKINSGNTDVGVWDLAAHELVWKALGYDPKVQQKDGPFKDGYRIEFRGENPDGQVFLGQGWWTCPGPGYYVARFSTIPIGFSDRTDAGAKADNDGQVRAWYALNEPGVSLLFPGAQQEIEVGIGVAPFIEGQLNRPPDQHSFTDSGGDADSTGYFALRGKYRESVDEDPIDMVQVFKGSWRNQSGSYGENNLSVRQLYLSRWLDPRFFGIDRKPLDRVWAVAKGGLEMVPFSLVGYNLDHGDRADIVLLRTLLSTGTASFTGYEGQNAARDLGDNTDPDSVFDEGNDAELADLGLGVYHALVDAKSFTDTAKLLPGGGGNSPLNRVKFGIIGSFDSQELIQRILGPRGWAMGWAGGQFRLFSRPQPLRFEDATVTISPDDFASDDVPYVEDVELTPMSPKERFKVPYGEPLVSEVGPESEPGYSVRALDPGAKVRHSNAELDIDSQGLIPTELWKADPAAPPSWRSAFAELWSQTMATWFAAPHVLVKGVPVLYSKGKDIGVGTAVRFTSHFAPSREGTYGLANRVGRVYRAVHNLQDLTTKLDILIQPGDPLIARRWAPIAVVVDDAENVEDRYDRDTRTFTCYSNFFAHGNDAARDLRYFVEPEGLGVGGNALVYGYQWNGREWSKNFEFTVESVDLTTNTIVHTPVPLNGTFWEAQYTVLCLAPYDDQPPNSWPRAFFSVHTRSDFHFGAGPTKGFKLS